MNLELAYSILDILETMQDAVRQMRIKYEEERLQEFNGLSMDLWDGLTALQEVAGQEIPRESGNRLADACTCALESLKDIKMYAVTEQGRVSGKLAYELLPIVRSMILQFYYWGIVDGRPEKEEEFRRYVAINGINEYQRRAAETGEYKYDLTIYVLAYNHLDVTKRCVSGILENLPQGVSFELVLFNHGSCDGTKEYFENIPGAKVINCAVNSALLGVQFGAFEGRYILSVCNDVVVGSKSIDNLYRCAAETPGFGWAVPATPNVSNWQSIPVNYREETQFKTFAESNNRYDVSRHEQKPRLCNPIDIMSSDIFFKVYEDLYIDLFGVKNHWFAFPDDKISLWMRRHGYLQFLAKDAYCHHFGSVTVKGESADAEETDRRYELGMKDFLKRYGINPWGTGVTYEPQLFQNWNIPARDNARILGLNCGIGATPLKIKEVLREKGATGTVIWNGVQDGRYLQDLKGVSDMAFCFEMLNDIVAQTGEKRYDYIVVEEPIENCGQNNLIKALSEAGLDFGELVFRTGGRSWKVVSGEKKA